MTVDNSHLDTTCQVWDGHAFHNLSRAKATEEEDAGLVQITENLQASELLTPKEFKDMRAHIKKSAEPTPKAKAAPPSRKVAATKPASKRTYKTREMKADGAG